MKRKELWLALSALSIVSNTDVLISDNFAVASERAGVASQVNPDVSHLTAKGSRVLFIGSDIFRNETIRTETTGMAHLMFLDKSSLTIGPNSEMTIDHFVYDPETNSGDLSMSAKKGLLHFVGGDLSKSGDGVKLKTPIANLGIRGAVAIIDVMDNKGGTTAYLLYGKEISVSIPGSGLSKSIKAHEHYLSVTPDGRIETGPIPPDKLAELLSKTHGTENKAQITENKTPNIVLPGNYLRWMRGFSNSDRESDLTKTEQSNIDRVNRDIFSIGS